MFLTFDVGTTTMKTAVFNDDFRQVAAHACEYALSTPEEGRVELNPRRYWDALREGIARVTATGVRPADIDCLTITTQGETLIPVDGGGEPLCDAIVWLDARAGAEAAHLARVFPPERFFRTTGMREAGAASPLAKLLWLRRNRPQLCQKTRCFFLLEDYLIHCLTGEWVTEHALLSSTGYFDINNDCWWQAALDEAGISPAQLPRPLPCGALAGAVTQKAAEACGLLAGTPVVTGAMDQIAGAIGAGNVRAGVVSETTGTALVLAATVDEPNYDTMASLSISKHYDGRFLCLPYNPTAAIILKWFKDEFMPDLVRECAETGGSVYGRMNELAERSPPGARGLVLVPHFAGKLVPDTNPHAKGLFYGIGLHHRREDFIRAIMEGVGYLLRENLECLEACGVEVSEIRSLGGGANSDLWTQIKADICARRLLAMEQAEAASLGAAMLGARGVGKIASVRQAAERHAAVRRAFEPNAAARLAYEQGYGLYQRLYTALLGVFDA